MQLVKFAQKVFRLRIELSMALEESLKRHDLSVPEWLMLHSLKDAKNGIRMNDLASLQGVKKSTVTKIFQSLLKKSFAYRIMNPDDTRSVIVGITPIGIKHLALVDREIKDRQSGIKKGIVGDQWDEITNYLSN